MYVDIMVMDNDVPTLLSSPAPSLLLPLMPFGAVYHRVYRWGGGCGMYPRKGVPHYRLRPPLSVLGTKVSVDVANYIYYIIKWDISMGCHRHTPHNTPSEERNSFTWIAPLLNPPHPVFPISPVHQGEENSCASIHPICPLIGVAFIAAITFYSRAPHFASFC